MQKHYSKFYPISYYIGIVLLVLGAIQALPLLTALLYGEWDISLDFTISITFTTLIGIGMALLGGRHKKQKLGWGESMSVAAGSWLVGMALCALPYKLSGNYHSYLDCCFDVMSGLTTTGMVLIRDMDHVSNGINMWRHLLTFVGGQGMVVLTLSLLLKGFSGVYKMYVGEGKDEKLMPNTLSTSRQIWLISLIYLLAGTLALWIAGLMAGLAPDRAFLHGLWIFMSAWSTGGFAPMSQSILYYHSALYEIITMVLFIIGSLNFALHYAVMSGKRREITRNIEAVSFTVTVTVLTLITTLGLMRLRIYPDTVAMFRKGFYQLISGHTTTGFMTIYARQFYNEWGEVALFALIIAMLIGGSACSTAGGFKGLRMGILFSAFKKDIRRNVMPESVVSVQKYHHIRDVILEDSTVRSALLIVAAYILTFTIGTIACMLYGYPFAMAAFETASATGNVGLTIGLIAPDMPAVLKMIFIIIMWMARLEFMSVLALGAYLASEVKKKCTKY
jgi:trk system potassium uptake protein